MSMKKSQILEILDADNGLIGNDDKPQVSNNAETEAGGLTDRNAQAGHQSFGNDFLGRFGFYFYESEGQEPLRNKIAKETYNYFDSDDGLDGRGWEGLSEEAKHNYLNFADKIIRLFDEGSNNAEKTLSESEMKKIVEDIVSRRKDKSVRSKYTFPNMVLNDSDAKVNKLVDKILDLSDEEKEKLIKILNHKI